MLRVKLLFWHLIAFNTRFNLDDVQVEGIESIEACDIKYATDLGYAVKLLAIARTIPKTVSACVLTRR